MMRKGFVFLSLLLAVAMAALSRAPVGAQEIPPNVRFLIGRPGAICGSSPEQFSGDIVLPGPDGWYEDIYRCDSPNCPYGDVDRLVFCSYDNFNSEIEQELTQTYMNASACTAWAWVARPTVYNSQYTGQQINSWSNLSFGALWSSSLRHHINVGSGGFCEIVQRIYAPGGLQPPAADLCEDGTELLTSGPVTLLPDEFVHTTGITTTPTAQIRYTLLTSGTHDVAGNVTLQNDPSMWSFPFSHVAPAEIITATVPTYQALPLSRISGTDEYMAYFQLDNTGDYTFTVASVCLISPRSIVPECPGIEGITEPPEIVTRGLGSWSSGVITTSYAGFEVTYWLNLLGNTAAAAGTLGANSKHFAFSVSSSPLISITIPLTGAIRGPNASLFVQNTGVQDFALLSACIEPKTDPQRQCNIINHDFVDGEAPWVTFPGSQTWLSGVENGALEIDGITYGRFVTDTQIIGNFRYEARVRAADGTSDVKLWLQEPQSDYWTVEVSRTVGAEWQVIGFDAYLNDPNRPIIQAENGAAEVDWVCIYKTSSRTRFSIPYCQSVDFTDHPEFTLLDISYWIFWLSIKINAIIDWLVCMFWRIVAIAFNALFDVLERIGIEPPLIGEYDLAAWFHWFTEVITSGFNWFNTNLQAGRLSIRNILEWLTWEIFYPIPQWLATMTRKGWEGLADWVLAHLSAFLNLAQPLSARAIIRDAELFWRAIQDELGLELQSLLLLLEQTGEVFGVLIDGYRSSLSGEVSADFGQSLGGLAGYLWAGVRWVDESIQNTPLTAVNLLAMGIISWGLITWTIGKFSRMLSKLG